MVLNVLLFGVRAPKIWQKIGMEWLYRCMKEPKRLFKRYFVDDMQFFYYFGKQLLGIYKVLSEKSRNGNFTRLYWAIRGHKFAYPGRKDTIKACIYVKELVRFMLYRLEHHEHGVELYNCCFEPAYTIQHIVEAMKKVTGLTQFVPDIPNWVIMPMARAAMLLGSPMGICPARYWGFALMVSKGLEKSILRS